MDIGSIWNGWRVEKLLGEGSFGKVYKITKEEFGVSYDSALKVIHIPQNQSEVVSIRNQGMTDESVTLYYQSMVQELVSEFALMSRFRGTSNIVSYEDHRVDEESEGIGWTIYIRMELLTPLYEYLSNNKLSVRDVIKLGIDMCQALELCQRFNIIHRDLKPENIFVSRFGDYKLGDFGIARQLEKTSSNLSKKGTYTYMAPEVYKGMPYNSTVDIYSLGIVLYSFLNNNRTPFLPPYPETIRFSDKEKANILRMSGKELPSPSKAKGRLAEIVLKACAYNPEDRYESAADMRRALELVLYDESEVSFIYPEGDSLISDKQKTQEDDISLNSQNILPTENEKVSSENKEKTFYLFKSEEQKAREEAERRAREEAERKAREEAERKAREEAERRAREEAERRAREEAERRAHEEAERRAREEAERRAREEAERRAREEAERRAREEAERKAREEAERKAREEAERKAREEAERKAREEAERRAREEAERKAREVAERRAREEAERKAREEAKQKAREETDRKAREKEEAERIAREEKEKKKQEKERNKAQSKSTEDESSKKKKKILLIALIAIGVVVLGVVIGFVSCHPSTVMVKVPSVIELTENEAKELLDQSGLKMKLGKPDYSKDVEVGHIISQSVEAGKEVNEGTAITVILSLGESVKVPKLTGISLNEAKKTVSSIGSKLTVEKEQYSDKVKKGYIISQKPSADEIVAKGTEFKVVVSKGSEPVKMPYVIGMTKNEAKNALEKVGLIASFEEEYNKASKGTVFAQEVDSGEEIQRGSTVAIYISLGSKPTAPTEAPVVSNYSSDNGNQNNYDSDRESDNDIVSSEDPGSGDEPVSSEDELDIYSVPNDVDVSSQEEVDDGSIDDYADTGDDGGQIDEIDDSDSGQIAEVDDGGNSENDDGSDEGSIDTVY